MSDTCLAPCLVCGAALGNFEPDSGNHPLGGLEFVSPGHYGSRLFDMEPGSLVVNICDDCVSAASQTNRVLHRTQAPSRRPREKFKLWHASGTPTRRAETTGSVAEGDGGPTAESGDAQ